MLIIYPFPMHLSIGANYHQSITSFLLHLSKLANVKLFTLDSTAQLNEYIYCSIGHKDSHEISHTQVKNSFLRIKSNKIFSLKIALQIYHILKSKNYSRIIIYTRDIKQLSYLLKFPWPPHVEFLIESHQLLSLTYWRETKIKKAIKEKRLEKFIYNKVDYIAAITQTLKEEIILSYAPQRKPFVLPIGVSEQFFVPPIKKKFDIVYSGGYAAWKGLTAFYNSLQILDQSIKKNKIQILFIGTTKNEREEILKISKKLRMINVVIYPKIKNSEIPSLLAQSRIGIAPSSYLGDGLLFTSPLKIYEYLAAGLEVISAQTPPVFSAFLGCPSIHWVHPASSNDYAEKLLHALKGTSHNIESVKYAKQFTWGARAIKLISKLEK